MMRVILILFSVMVFLLRGQVLGAEALNLVPKTNEWVEDYDGVVLRELQRQGHIQGKILKKKAVVPTSARDASRLLFIKTTHNSEDMSYVIKEVVRSSREQTEAHAKEKELIGQHTIYDFNAFINMYEKRNNVRLPKLIDYHATTVLNVKGYSMRITITSKAKGDSLADISSQLSNQNKFTSRSPDSNFPQFHDAPSIFKRAPFTEEEAVHIGTDIGQQVGALIKAFKEERQSILSHGDMGPQNLMYDLKRRQLYWIDLGGTMEISWAHNPDQIIRGIMISMLNAFLPHIRWINSTTNGELSIDFITRVKKFSEIEGYQKASDDYNAGRLSQDDFLNLFYDKFSKQFDEKIPLKNFMNQYGIDILKKHRLGLLMANAFLAAYKQHVKNLASDINIIHEEIARYKVWIQRIFGADAPRVLNYLLAPVQTNVPFDKVNTVSNGVRMIESELRESTPNTKKLLDIMSGKEGGLLGRSPSTAEFTIMVKTFKAIAKDNSLDVEAYFKGQKFLKVSIKQKNHQIICCGVLLILRAGGSDTGIQDKIKNIFSKEIKPDLFAKIKGITSKIPQ